MSKTLSGATPEPQAEPAPAAQIGWPQRVVA
jgi:hypothetical protein